MLSTENFNAVLAIAFFAAVSLLASLLHRRHRRERAATVAAARPRCWEPEDKPQNSFKRVLANNSYTPFKHLRREGQDKEISLKIHPYEEEINLLLEQPPIFTKFVTSQECPDMAAHYEWIHTEQQLENLASLLSKEQIFAVDTEQHSVRSFLGFTALMQVSTENEDFLIDTIALHDVMGTLRPVFADPSICKVFHGSDNDVLWLQRDFHIYVVNMFDTAKACEVLSKPYKSLAYLLETYCGVSTDKTFQREDWRQRPLSQDMIQYARSDAHYLLYIADCLTSELKKETLASSDDKYNEACRRANMVCLQLYVKEIESSPGVLAAASIYSRNFNMHGITSSKSCEIKDRIWKMCAWRDLMARIHDESLRYVLSEKAIVALAAEIPKEPMEVYDVIAEAESSCESSSINSLLPSPSPIVKSHLNELCFLLQETNANLNDEFRKYLQKHLAPTGCCSLSVYNFALSSEFSLKGKSTLFSKQSGRKLATHIGKKASRELFVQKFSCKSPVYHNCRIYASDGRLLCYCDSRKLQWYLRRDLAKLVETDPLAIMLLFEPKGRPEDEDNDFYIQSKKNICVGCGEKNHYLRYRVIPSCYRIYFPEHLKSHRSHDIVLLCVDCHEIAHCAAEKYKRLIANEFKIPLFVQKIVDRGESKVTDMATKSTCGVEEGVSPLQLRSAAMALLRHGSSMPVERRDELMQTVRDYFGGRDISTEDLEMALLVGMSPHERRKLEKKRGIHLKHSEWSATPKIDESTSLDTIVESHELSKGRDAIDIDAGGANASRYDLDVVLDVDTCHGGPERDNAFSLNNHIGNGDQSDDIGGSSPFLPHQASSKSLKKLSLLGHGPHGKMVVDHILQTDGEDGINQFCRRWRQVFVEAVHPRFLPSGWDVMHSGRREFGDYSVYNPAKKDVQLAGS